MGLLHIIIISYNDVFIGINNAHFFNFAIAGREVRNGFSEYSFKRYTTMKEFLNMMEKDYKNENFTIKETIVFGVIAPIVILAIIGIIGWLDSIGMSGAY